MQYLASLRNNKKSVLQALLAAFILGLMAAEPAFAGGAVSSKVNSTMAQVQSVLTGVSVVAFTVSIMWVGYKMAFQHAKWSEVANILIGGVFIGAASLIASMVVA